MFGRKAARIRELEARERILLDACARLYLMTQDGKRLLLSWRATSNLTKTQKTTLRVRTNAYLRRSSTAIITAIYGEADDD